MEKGREQPAGMLCRKQSWKQAWLGEEKKWERAELRGSWLLQSKQSRAQKPFTGEWLLGPSHARAWERMGLGLARKRKQEVVSWVWTSQDKCRASSVHTDMHLPDLSFKWSGASPGEKPYLPFQAETTAHLPTTEHYTWESPSHGFHFTWLLCFVGAGKPGSDVTFWFECLPSLRALMGSHPTNSTLLMALGKSECLHGLHVHTQSSWSQRLRFPRPDKYATYYLIYKYFSH